MPATAIAALKSPNALVSQAAMQQLSDLMAQVPNGSALMAALLEAARVGLASGIQRGFFLTLGVTVLALGCCLLVGKIHLSEVSVPGRGVWTSTPSSPESADWSQR